MKKLALFLCALLFTSCFGMSSDINIKNDGSGSIALVYRISEDVLKLGTLDGNGVFPAVPVGEEDFKRTVERMDGLTLKKFSSKSENEDIVYHVTIDFANIAALIQFLDTQGQYCQLTEQNGRQILTIVFAPGTDEYTPEMLELFPVIFDGYDFNFKISVARNCEVVFFDKGKTALAAPPVGKAETRAKSVTFFAPMGDLFAAAETAALEIRW